MSKPLTDEQLRAISDPVARIYEAFRSKSDTGARVYKLWDDLSWWERELFVRGYKLGRGGEGDR